jgi:hypothetical protein
MISTSHPNAAEHFDRDVGCLVKFFMLRCGLTPQSFPTFAALPEKTNSLDVRVEASGFFSAQQARDFEALWDERAEREGDRGGDEDEDEDEDDDGSVDEGGDEGSKGEGKGEGEGEGGLGLRVGAAVDEGREAGELPEATRSDAGAAIEFVSLSAEILGDRIDGDDGGEGLATAEGGADVEVDDEDGEGEGEGEGESESEDEVEDLDEEAAARARRQAALDERALAALRPPEGVRTMPGGRRIKPRGGEAYLRHATDGRGGTASSDGASVASSKRSMRLPASEDVRGRVRETLARAQDKKERADIIGRAVGANDNKDRKNAKIRQHVVKSDGVWDDY